MAVSKAHLHSTMYLLKPNKLATGNKNPVFTFHYVSIKTFSFRASNSLFDIYIPLCIY